MANKDTSDKFNAVPEDFVFLDTEKKEESRNAQKIEFCIDPLSKQEKHYEYVTVHPKTGKPFKRKQLVGRKEGPKTAEANKEVSINSILSEADDDIKKNKYMGYVSPTTFMTLCKNRGLNEDDVAEMRDILDLHANGGKPQAVADKKIVENLRKNTGVGKVFKLLSELETSMSHMSLKAEDAALEKAKKRYKSDLEFYNSIMSDPEEAQIEAQQSLDEAEITHHRNLYIYRKGEVGKDVESWSTSAEGAWQGQGQSRLTPNHKQLITDINKNGYMILGGFTRKIGQSGEAEILLVNKTAIDGKPVAKIEFNISSLSKQEKYKKRVLVHRRGQKPFYREQLVGRKEAPKKELKTTMIPKNVKNIASGHDIGIEGSQHEADLYIVTFNDNSKGIYKVLDRVDGIGEVGYYKTSQILGWNICPETTEGDFSKGRGTCQRFIENGEEPYDGSDEGYGVRIDESHFDDLSKIFVMDTILGNLDRHSGNVIIKGDKCYAIDNEDWGTAGQAKYAMEALDYTGNKPRGLEYTAPMIGWMKKNLNVDQQKKFKIYVMKNLKEALKHKDQINKFYGQYRVAGIDAKVGARVDSVGEYIDYLEKYLNQGEKS